MRVHPTVDTTYRWGSWRADFQHDVVDQLQSEQPRVQTLQVELVFHVIVHLLPLMLQPLKTDHGMQTECRFTCEHLPQNFQPLKTDHRTQTKCGFSGELLPQNLQPLKTSQNAIRMWFQRQTPAPKRPNMPWPNKPLNPNYPQHGYKTWVFLTEDNRAIKGSPG